MDYVQIQIHSRYSSNNVRRYTKRTVQPRKVKKNLNTTFQLKTKLSDSQQKKG